MLGRQRKFAKTLGTETVGALGQVVPKRLAGLSVSTISRSKTSLDEFDPERAGEFDLERVDEYGPEPMRIIPQLPDVEPGLTQTYHSDNRGTRNIFFRTIDL